MLAIILWQKWDSIKQTMRSETETPRGRLREAMHLHGFVAESIGLAAVIGERQITYMVAKPKNGVERIYYLYDAAPSLVHCIEREIQDAI